MQSNFIKFSPLQILWLQLSHFYSEVALIISGISAANNVKGERFYSKLDYSYKLDSSNFVSIYLVFKEFEGDSGPD